ncbi:predicted protein [Plenodomus lingam JN3]|uniref:Predicted protein n=1 Tax=Leptosphaeria maculans (strain JN3 / isolate v23.1.3 / race Av1-4-5-6-7-8) TaxID=985895 RepID=E4ZYT2_LEPMJ|nr:predicted protein [Plenodomus lingam JN3]CBX96608.1 predicted protein [Plenodomus lingam JN3]
MTPHRYLRGFAACPPKLEATLPAAASSFDLTALTPSPAIRNRNGRASVTGGIQNPAVDLSQGCFSLQGKRT